LKIAAPPFTLPLTGTGFDVTVPVPVPAFVTVRVIGLIAKPAETVQGPVIAAVVYVLPERLPPHPLTKPIE